jgi:arylsulfatase A-like enzyme
MFKGQLQNDRISIPTSEDINTYVMPIIEQLKNEPFFLFIWSIDTHNPYFIRGRTDRFSPSPNQNIFYHRDVMRMKTLEERQKLVELYEKMIYFNDYQIGHLLEHLKNLSLYEETLIIIVSDHGEAFGEHGRNSHCSIPYDEQIRVPLIIKFPRGQFAGHKSERLSQLIDIFPTLLDYLNIIPDLSLQGKSLLPAIRQWAEVHRVVYSIGNYSLNLVNSFSIRTQEWKLILLNPPRFSIKLFKARPETIIKYFKSMIFQPRKMLFNLIEDCEERRNLVAIKRDTCAYLERFRMELVKQNEEFRNSSKITTELCSDIKDYLKALGYIN